MAVAITFGVIKTYCTDKVFNSIIFIIFTWIV